MAFLDYFDECLFSFVENKLFHNYQKKKKKKRMYN